MKQQMNQTRQDNLFIEQITNNTSILQYDFTTRLREPQCATLNLLPQLKQPSNIQRTTLTRKLQQQIPSIIQGYIQNQGQLYLNPNVFLLEQDYLASNIILVAKTITILEKILVISEIEKERFKISHLTYPLTSSSQKIFN